MEFVEKDAKRMSLEDFLRWLDEMKTADGLEQLVNCILVEGCEENIKTWFRDIFKDQPTGLLPPQATSNSFSQPLRVTVLTTNGAQVYSSQP